MKKYLNLFLIAVVFSSCKKDEYKVISLEEYSDKMKAAWVGQMVGVAWGGPTEFKFNEKTIPENEVPEWKSEKVNDSFNQDDIYVELTFVRSLEKYGIKCDIRQAGIDFANSEYILWGANHEGRSNLLSGIAPPASSHPKFNKGTDWIDYQIEADYSGIIAPGMPNVPVELGEVFGRLMNYGDGLYGGQFVGAMYSHAFFENDIKTVINKSLESIPYESQYAECMRDVVRWHEEDPGNWKNTWQKIEDKYFKNPEYQKYKQVSPDYYVDMDAKLNGAYIVMGLLYGNGDPDSTMVISMRCGRDSDCNPSNAAGILFTTLGYKNLSQKYTESLDTTKKFSFTDYSFNELTRVSEKLTKEFVLARGGKIEKNEAGKEVLYIPSERSSKSKFLQSWEPEKFSGDSTYTQAEMAKIIYRSYKDFIPALSVLKANKLHIDFAGKASEKDLISWRGKDKVLKTFAGPNNRSLLWYGDVLINEDSKNFSFLVSNDESGSYKLKITLGWHKIVFEETIDNKATAGGWKNIHLDLSEYIGKRVNIQIEQIDENGSGSAAYWTDFSPV